jgi:polyketide biosynthesis enoyl-CoA hydratase PksH
MNYNTLQVKESEACITITMNRPLRKNSLNEEMVSELSSVLQIVQTSPDYRVVVLEGHNGIFCTGLDFEEIAVKDTIDNADEMKLTRMYMDILRCFSLMPRVVIAKVDGQVMAGGVGLAAASDLVVATSRSQFSLSEILWGMLPSMVVPYLIRRVGFQKAYSMTLTTLPVSAEEGLRINLIDELSDELDESIRRICMRLTRLDDWAIGNMKQYFRNAWIITEQMETAAVNETSKLVAHPKVRRNIENFVKYKIFPWNSK